MNDITLFSDLFKFVIYADYTTLSSILNKFQSLNCQSQSQNINNEFKKNMQMVKGQPNKLSLNVKKTKVMKFHMAQKKIKSPVLQIDGTNIECVNYFNFLGITINIHLNKIIKTIGILNNKLKYVLPLNILSIMYNSLILPNINYGILMWGHQAHHIFKFQKSPIRIVTLSKYNPYTDPIYIELKFLKLDDINKLQKLKFYFKLINKLLPEYFNQIPYAHNFEIHQYYTRGRNNLFIPTATYEFATKYTRHNIIQSVNNTLNIILEIFFIHSLYSFFHLH